MNDLRIGHGYDVHAFKVGDHIVLGGVSIPHNKAFQAHSDADGFFSSFVRSPIRSAQ